MLVVSRKKNEKIVVADQIEITILDVRRNQVRLGIKAPRHIYIETHAKPNEGLEPVGVGAADISESSKISNVTPFPGARIR